MSLLLLEVPHLLTPCVPLRIPPACILPLLNLVRMALSANAALPHHLRFLTSYPPSPHFVSPTSAPSSPHHVFGCFPIPPASSSPLTRSGFFNGMTEVSVPGALNYYTLSCLVLWIISVFRNPTLTYLPLFRSLYSLLCDLIALTPGLAFFLLMTRTLPAASSFSSEKAYPSLKFPPLLSLCLIPTLII